jgi:5-methyltetrahydropteroyltriglutamate--homocysteine methyltransferase
MNDQPTITPTSTVYGYPRQGSYRELKKITEDYWSGAIDETELLERSRDLRLARWRELQDAGLDEIPGNDFSLYDHVLDTSVLLGAIPPRHVDAVSDVSTPKGQLDRYFAMARGTSDVAPLEMTKWFGTNYHYLVPEIGPETEFRLNPGKPISEFVEALGIGIETRPVILGPVSYLLLAKATTDTSNKFNPIDRLDDILPLYVDLLKRLEDLGATWCQLDEPALVTDQSATVFERVAYAYEVLGETPDRPKILVASYFGHLGEALGVLAQSPIEGLALDFTNAGKRNLDLLAAIGGLPNKRLVAGVVDGHNVWTTDLTQALSTLTTLHGLAARVDVAASCSLLHVPLDVDLERKLDDEIVPWLAFARQKVEEIVLLTKGLGEGREAIAAELANNRAILTSRSNSKVVRVEAVRQRIREMENVSLHRQSDYSTRAEVQEDRLNLPLLPTTTIGSFPQTSVLRRARAALSSGTIDRFEYEELMRQEIQEVILLQEELGIDVLVHGEPERNDMVQYFAEQLDGFLATSSGWVQSYGSRYVRPPIVFGDVSRPSPMTVSWTVFAQSLTKRPVKGMLTGPITMLAWSFVRDDQPVGDTARQVALALRDEVLELERAGVAIIQVDEPALRETLPLRKEDRASYLTWAVQAFLLTTTGVRDDTQIHTHMCYAEFGDVLNAIVEMDADVISLESARSKMSIVADLARTKYANEIGPGVWDIHSPRIPSVNEIEENIRIAMAAFPRRRLWVNPDCGLKTRMYPEVRATLANLVAATNVVRIDS